MFTSRVYVVANMYAPVEIISCQQTTSIDTRRKCFLYYHFRMMWSHSMYPLVSLPKRTVASTALRISTFDCVGTCLISIMIIIVYFLATYSTNNIPLLCSYVNSSLYEQLVRRTYLLLYNNIHKKHYFLP